MSQVFNRVKNTLGEISIQRYTTSVQFFPLHVHDTNQKPLHVKPSRYTSPRKKQINRRGTMKTGTSNLLRMTAMPSLNTRISPKIPVELELFLLRLPPWPTLPWPPTSSPVSLPVTGAALAAVSIVRRWRFRGSRGFQFLNGRKVP